MCNDDSRFAQVQKQRHEIGRAAVDAEHEHRDGVDLIEHRNRHPEQDEHHHEHCRVWAHRPKHFVQIEDHENLHDLGEQRAGDAGAEQTRIGRDIGRSRRGVAGHEDRIGHVQHAEYAERDEPQVEETGGTSGFLDGGHFCCRHGSSFARDAARGAKCVLAN